MEDGFIGEAEESAGFVRNGFGGIGGRVCLGLQLGIPPELAGDLCIYAGLGSTHGFRFDARHQDSSGDAGRHQQNAGFAVAQDSVERVAIVQFRGAALEAADDGVGGFLVEGDPANHSSNPRRPRWACNFAILA